MSSENTLRTLKDITNSILPYCAEKAELRQEAIKWVKRLSITLTDRDWMDFFNITEEDLK